MPNDRTCDTNTDDSCYRGKYKVRNFPLQPQNEHLEGLLQQAQQLVATEEHEHQTKTILKTTTTKSTDDKVSHTTTTIPLVVKTRNCQPVHGEEALLLLEEMSVGDVSLEQDDKEKGQSERQVWEEWRD